MIIKDWYLYDDGGAARPTLDQTFLLQTLKRLTHGALAGAHLLGNISRRL